MNRMFQQTYHIPGALAADLAISLAMPCDATLVHVSACGSNAAAAGLSIGDDEDNEAYLPLSAIGVSGTPEVFERLDFTGDQYPRLQAGELLYLSLDFDYNNGGAALASANVTLALTFLEG